jgi:hypothetical protein
MVFLADANFPGWGRLRWNARIDHQPASIPPRTFGAWQHPGAYYLNSVTCPTGVRREYRAAYIKRPRTAIDEALMVGTLICGPDIATGDAAVRNLLASIRVTK